MKLIHLYQAWKILPNLGKALVIVGEGVSAIIYWAGTEANPNYGCVTSFCDVTRQNIETTKLSGISLMVLCSTLFVFTLILVGVTLEKQEAKGRSFEEMAAKIKGIEKQAVKETIYYKIYRFLLRTYACLIFGVGLDLLSLNAILRNPSLAGQIIVSWGFTGIGLTLIGIGLAVVKWFENEPAKLSQ